MKRFTAVLSISKIIIIGLFLSFGEGFAQCEQVDVFFKMGEESAPVASEKLEGLSNKRVTSIKAYCDTSGPGSYNLVLSEKRAKYMKTTLHNRGFDVSNTKVEWFGELVDNNKDSKRVEVLFCNEVEIAPNDSGELININDLKEKKQVFEITNNRDTILFGKRGTVICIPANAFNTAKKKSIRFELTEFYSRSQMILNNLTTTSGNEAIETGGMVNIEAFQDSTELSLNNSKELKLIFPLATTNKGFQTFNGVHGHDSVINWVPGSGTRRGNQGESGFYAICYKKRFPNYLFSPVLENDIEQLKKYAEESFTTDFYRQWGLKIDYRRDVYFFDKKKNTRYFDKTIEDLYTELLNENILPEGYLAFELNKASKAKNYNFTCAKNSPDTTLQKFDSIMHWKKVYYSYIGLGLLNLVQNPTDIRTSNSYCFFDMNYKTHMRNNLLADKILSVMAKKGALDIEAIDAAVLYTSKLGMVNCDRFLNSGKTLKNLIVEHGNHDKVYLIYKNIKSILPANRVGKVIKFLNVPLNEPIVLLGIKEKGGKIKVAKKELTFDGRATKLDDYKFVSNEAFKKLLSELDDI